MEFEYEKDEILAHWYGCTHEGIKYNTYRIVECGNHKLRVNIDMLLSG